MAIVMDCVLRTGIGAIMRLRPRHCKGNALGGSDDRAASGPRELRDGAAAGSVTGDPARPCSLCAVRRARGTESVSRKKQPLRKPVQTDLSRRQFLVRSAGIAGASMGLAPRATAKAGETGEPVRLGFVGVGDRGRYLLGMLLRPPVESGSLPRIEVTALCDTDPQALRRGRELAEGLTRAAGRPVRPRGFTDHRALLDQPDVDAVFIATPVFCHARQAVAALESDKHVYCEKPLGRSAAECREVLAAAARAEGSSGRVFQVGLQRRYNPRYRASLEFVRSGRAGRVLFVRAQWHTSTPSTSKKRWLYQREKSGDILLEQACHQLDVCNWLYGAVPERAVGLGGTNCSGRDPHGRDTMDHCAVVLEYPGGGKVDLSVVSYAVSDRRFQGIHELVFCEGAGVQPAIAVARLTSGETLALEGGATALTGNDTALALADFVRSIREGRRPEADARVGYEASLAALLCQRAIESGRAVAFSEVETS